MRVLVVEDDHDLADAIARGLRLAGFAVDIALDGGEGLDRAAATACEVVVLDRQLPGILGDGVCRALLAETPTPRVLMVTAAGDLDAMAQGLAIRADDYPPKPFAMVELVARVRALGRPDAATLPVLVVQNLAVVTTRRRAIRNNRPLPLTRKELGALEVIAADGGRVVSAEELLERVRR